MLDHYYIKLPDLIRYDWVSNYDRGDIPERESHRYDFLWELYRYELWGWGGHNKFDPDYILVRTLFLFEGRLDNSKYRRYLKYLGIKNA